MVSQMVQGTVSGSGREEGSEFKRARTAAWNDVLSALVDPAGGLDENERKGYEQKIMQKLRMGKRLTAEELNYLRVHNPELYRSAARVENARKALRIKLQNCKSKEEVSQVIAGQMETLKAMENDPDREYMTAMVKEEIGKFKKSREYARLPLKREEGRKKADRDADRREEGTDLDEYEEYSKVMVYSRMKVQCVMIAKMAQAFVS